jgi:hypothetical protein
LRWTGRGCPECYWPEPQAGRWESVRLLPGILQAEPVVRGHRAVGRCLADRAKHGPGRLGLVSHRQADLSNGPLITPADLGQDPVCCPLGRRTLLFGHGLGIGAPPALAIAYPPSSARIARTASMSARRSPSARILAQSTPASSCARTDAHAREIRASVAAGEGPGRPLASCSARWWATSASASAIVRLVLVTTVWRSSRALASRSWRRSLSDAALSASRLYGSGGASVRACRSPSVQPGQGRWGPGHPAPRCPAHLRHPYAPPGSAHRRDQQVARPRHGQLHQGPPRSTVRTTR